MNYNGLFSTKNMLLFANSTVKMQKLLTELFFLLNNHQTKILIVKVINKERLP